jgi:hypothetical protein
LVACYLAVLILIAEKLKSLFSTDGEITRKVVPHWYGKRHRFLLGG